MARKRYKKLQAASLLDIARSINNPELVAALIDKAADLHDEAESLPPSKDNSAGPPDVEMA